MGKNTAKACGVCRVSPFVRNNYFYGKLMTVRDYFAEQAYFNEKRWLINRMVNGTGVVCGLDVVEKSGDTVCVTPGLAIDDCGREIALCEEQVVSLDWEPSEEGKEESDAAKRIICIEYYECNTEPVALPPIVCDEKEKTAHNRIMESSKIKVVPYEILETENEALCPLDEKSASLHRYLCDKLRDERCDTCGECHCVVLAVVTKDAQGNIEIDNCSMRQQVYSNRVLYDLIHCFHKDLFHVVETGWPHRETIVWNDFVKLITKGVWIEFDRSIDPKTVDRFTFLVDAVITDESTSYDYTMHIPAEKIVSEENDTKFRFIPSILWIKDNVEASSILKNHGGTIRITLKSDFILDKNGIALDGNHIGGRLPSGNGTEGGDFVGWFVVNAKQQKRKS